MDKLQLQILGKIENVRSAGLKADYLIALLEIRSLIHSSEYEESCEKLGKYFIEKVEKLEARRSKEN